VKSSKRNVIRPLVIAMALALPGSAALGAQMDDVVTTRADQNIDQQYGRDSVYGFSPDSKPMKPEQSASRDFHPFAKMKSYAAEAWHKTMGVLKHHDSTSASNSQDVVKMGEASSNRTADNEVGAQDIRPESQSMVGAKISRRARPRSSAFMSEADTPRMHAQWSNRALAKGRAAALPSMS